MNTSEVRTRSRGEHRHGAARGRATTNTANSRQRRRQHSDAGDAARRLETTPEARSTESIELFMRDLRKHPLLTAAEEIELAKRIERGDLEAKNRMINSNLRLVMSQARRYQGHGLPLEDLVQEGMLGLIRAVEKFDWRRGFKFSTYGTLWIRQAMQRGLQNSGRTIRVPVHVAQREVKVRRIEAELSARLSRDPTDEEIAAIAELPIEQVAEIRELNHSITSLDRTVGEDGETTFGELLPSDSPDPLDEVAELLGERQVAEIVAQLPAPERDVIKLRFGLTGEQPRTIRETGRELGISPARATELEEQALDQLSGSPEIQALREAA